MKPLRRVCLAGFLVLLTGCPAGTIHMAPMDLANAFTPNMDFDYGPGMGWGLLAMPVSSTEEKKELDPSELADELEVGDIATIYTKQKKKHSFRVYRVGPHDFWGQNRDGKNFQVPYKHLVRVVVDRERSGRHVALVLLIGSPPPGGAPVQSVRAN